MKSNQRRGVHSVSPHRPHMRESTLPEVEGCTTFRQDVKVASAKDSRTK